jgi:3'-phosphoadenosine 5'-phosphosulfate sulfotransferase (PAPS reductase)/FAD synthetase
MSTTTIHAPVLVTDREAELARKIRDAEEIIRKGIVDHVLADGRGLAALAVMFSGGNDSTLLLHLLRNVATHAVHANTGIGIESTRQFVRDTCANWNIPLLEEHPPVSYDELVMDQGFPGPAHHYKMFQRLKERCIEQARSKLNPHYYRNRVVFFAGRRRAESKRRSKLPISGDRKGSMVFISPIINWTAVDMNTYRAMFNLPRNPVSDTLHMSGECLCGSFAAEGERDELRFWYPEVNQRIASLEQRVKALGTVPAQRCTWGWGANEGKGRKQSKVGIMCSSCEGKADGGEIVSTNAGPLPTSANVSKLPTITRPVDLVPALAS